MGIRNEINAVLKGMRKEAQVWGNYAPAHNQNAEANLAKKIPNMAWGTIGAGAGLAKGVWDRTVGGGSEGSWGDYLKAGFNSGFNHGDLAAAGLIEGAANSIPFVQQKAIPSFADYVRNAKVDAGMEPEVADTLRTGGNYAGMLAAQLPIWKAFGLAGKGVGALSNIAGNAAGKVLPQAGKVISKGAPLAFWGKAIGLDDHIADTYNHLTADSDLEFVHERIEALSRMNPEDPEYADQYELLKNWRKNDPQAFARLKQPVRPGPWLANASAVY